MTSPGEPARILFTHWGDEGIRGSERVLLDLLAKLDRSRYAPVLWSNGHAIANAAQALGVATHVSRMPILLGWDAPRLDVSAYHQLVDQARSLIRTEGIRLVHANSGAPNQWLVPAARSAEVPLVAHLHAIYGFRERCTLLLHQVPMVVGCSEAVVKPLRADGVPDRRLRVIHNGVDPDRLGAGSALGLRQSIGVSKESLLIVCVAALIPLKGIDIVLRAFQIVWRRGIDAHLAIVGEGLERDKLQALSNELGLAHRVHFLGPQRQVGAILRDAADIIAIGSRIEAFPLVPAEAGAVGRPVVATRVGGIPELVVDERTGLLVPPGDHEAFADALSRLARDAQLRKRLGNAARAHVLDRFTTERMAQAFEVLYAHLLQQPAATFGWFKQGVRLAPLARLGLAVVGRRLGMRIPDA